VRTPAQVLPPRPGSRGWRRRRSFEPRRGAPAPKSVTPPRSCPTTSEHEGAKARKTKPAHSAPPRLRRPAPQLSPQPVRRLPSAKPRDGRPRQRGPDKAIRGPASLAFDDRAPRRGSIPAGAGTRLIPEHGRVPDGWGRAMITRRPASWRTSSVIVGGHRLQDQVPAFRRGGAANVQPAGRSGIRRPCQAWGRRRLPSTRVKR